jgi:Cu(I)/Ag(I) efflux system protein CusF
MTLRDLRFFLLGLAPITLTACIDSEAATAPPTSMAPSIGVDLGSSSRVPHIAARASEGEDYERTKAGMTPVDHGWMAGMSHKPGTQVDQSSMPGMSHGSNEGMPVDHRSMAGMDPAAGGDMQMAHFGHGHAQATGTVNSVDAAAHKLNVSHGQIPIIGWPAMTMDFAVAPSVDLRAMKPGTRISFTIEQGDDGMYVIQSITPAGGGR